MLIFIFVYIFLFRLDSVPNEENNKGHTSTKKKQNFDLRWPSCPPNTVLP